MDDLEEAIIALGLRAHGINTSAAAVLFALASAMKSGTERDLAQSAQAFARALIPEIERRLKKDLTRSRL